MDPETTPTPRPTIEPIQTPIAMAPLGAPKSCNMDMYDQLIREGHTELEAWTIVNTEMDGAFESGSRGIDAWQTYCHELEYNEALDASPQVDIHPADEGDVWLVAGLGAALVIGGLIGGMKRARKQLAF